MPNKRKRCLSCKHADVVRYARNKSFPLGVFCILDKPEMKRRAGNKGFDPRAYLYDCSHTCDKWQGKKGAGE